MSTRTISRDQYHAAMEHLAKHVGIPVGDIFETHCHVTSFTVRAYDRTSDGQRTVDVIERTVYIETRGTLVEVGEKGPERVRQTPEEA